MNWFKGKSASEARPFGGLRTIVSCIDVPLIHVSVTSFAMPLHAQQRDRDEFVSLLMLTPNAQEAGWVGW